MPRKIHRSMCIRKGCYRDSLHKRLCEEHFAQEHPGAVVSEYRFRWHMIETIEGTIRATDKAEAFALVRKNVVAGQRVRPFPRPEDIELLGVTSCQAKEKNPSSP